MKTSAARSELFLLILSDELQVPIYLDKLRNYGYQNVISCTQGEEAIKKLASGKFSLVITDTELKGKMNGIDLGRKVRQEYNLPLIYLSSVQDETTLNRALETKPRAFLSVPVNWNELWVAIESAMFYNDEVTSLNSVINEFTHRFEENPLPYQILDGDGRLTSVNKAWINLMGYSANEVIGKWFGDFMTARFHPVFEQCFDIAKKAGSIHDLECDLIKKDGGSITIAFEGTVQYGLRKEILSIRCVLNDITEKQKIKENLLESEKRFRILFEEAPLGYQSLAGSGGIIYVNNTWCKMLGYSKKEAIGKWFGDFLAPADRDRFKRNFSVFRQKGKAYDINYKMIKKDGGEINIMIDGIVRYDEEGNYIQSHCILKDITAQKLSEDALLESEKKFRNLIESAGDIIYVLDHDLKYLYGNNQCLKRYGLTKEELIGRNYRDLHSAESLDEFNEKVMVIQKSEKPILYEHQSSIDGRYFLRTLSPLTDSETKETESIIVISRDITDHKMAEEKLRASEKRYSGLADSITDIFFAFDKDLKYTYWNKASEKLVGIDEKNVIGKSLYEIFPDTPQIRKAERIYRDVLKNKKARTFINDYTLGDKDFVLEISVYPAENGISVVAKDITERKRAEEEINSQREMLQIIFDHIPVMITYFDETGNIKMINYELVKKMGWGFEEWQTENILKKCYPDPKVYKEVLDFMISKPPDWKDFKATTKYSTLIDTTWMNIQLPNGVFMGIGQDITDRKQAEEELRRSEMQFRSLTENSPDLIARFDRQYRHLFVNPAAAKAGPYSFYEYVGKTIAGVGVPEEEARKWEERIRTAFETGQIVDVEDSFETPNGLRYFNTKFVPEFAPDGSIHSVQSIARDITEHKQMEETIRNLAKFPSENPDPVLRVDRDGQLLFANEASFKFLTWKLQIGEKTPSVLQKIIAEALKEGNRKIIDTEHNQRFISFSIVPVVDEGYANLYGRDITERKRIEKALEESEAMLRSILRTVSVGIGVVKNRVFEWTNETYRKITGFSESELRGKSTRMVYPDDEEFKRAGLMYEIMKKHGIGVIETKHKNKNGNIIDVLINIALIIPGDLNSGIAFTLLDITEKKNAEKDILEKSEDLSLLTNINALVNSGADIDSITGELSSEIKRIFDCDGAAVLLMDKKGESFVMRNIPFIKTKITGFERLIGQKLTGFKIKVSADFIHQYILESKKILLINSPDEIHQLVLKYAENPLMQKYIPDIIKLLGINSVIIIPLVSNNKPIGIIEISSRKVFKQEILNRIENLSENLANIIARKQTESELKASETRFRAFMENLPVMTYMKDKEGKFIYGNNAIIRFANRTPENYNGTLITEYLPKDMGEWMAEIDRKVLKTMKPIDLGEWRWVKDNRERWFKEFKFPIILPDGETIIGGWMMDVTARKIAESELKESESRYKDLVEKAGIAIMTDDIKGNITYFNREFARLFGYTIAEMKKQSLETLIYTGDLKQRISYNKKRIKGEKVPNSYELRGIKKNGNEIWIEFEITVLTEQNKIIGTRNYMWDVTNRKKIIEALENSETRFRELFSSISSGVAIYVYDPVREDYLFKDINMAGMAISQIKHKGDILNKYLLECFPGAKELGLWDTLNMVRMTGISQKVPNIFYKDQRISLYVENFVYKLPSNEMVVVYNDISEKVLAEKNILRHYNEINKLTHHLESVREEERKMIARDLHDDLGQILTAVKMDISWIRNKMPVEETGIKKRSESAIQIVDQAIQSIRRISSELRPVILDDLGLFETLKAHIRDYENRFKIIVNYKFPETEPELKPDQQISVFRIIQEALTNTARHSGASAVDLDIRKKDDNLKILIRDNGIGIPDQKLYSTDSFGLISMRERVLQWEGKITVRGKENEGTTINVSIPLK